ncbi:MAG: epoxyqueuosine reductase QueH [Lachnospiraceae bacterium]|nr:epoxyqueuosine reductase QueH [Lachnospiraceae bacterium]
MKKNYQKELDLVLAKLAETGERPRLLLHSCCAPCSSYVIEYLSRYFQIIVLYYNPNIFPAEEYSFRSAEEERFIREFSENLRRKENVWEPDIEFMSTEYHPEEFYEAVRGLEAFPEGGKRCEACFRLRLRRAAQTAKEIHADYFTTTLSISPLKSAELLNTIGEETAAEYGVPYLLSDFKKKGGYLRSVELSREYSMYRQDYCGCVFSREERRR